MEFTLHKITGRIKFVLLIFFFAVIPTLFTHAQTKNAPPNIIYIISDQMRADAMGAAGNSNARTPNLDMLAENGVMLGNRLAQHQKALHYDRITESDLKETMRYYHAAVEWGVDHQIGEILNPILIPIARFLFIPELKILLGSPITELQWPEPGTGN